MNEIINGAYRIIEEIGQGGGGIVYKAYHENLQKYVVLKQIKGGVSSYVDVRNEVDLLKNLKHTYLPQVLDFIEHDGKIFTVMDFVDGGDLKKNQNGKPLKTKDIIHYGVQLCEAVKYLHSQNPPVIHSDIKPDNIMLTKDNNICLIDFNISLMFDEQNGAIGGTRGFAAPEQLGMLKLPAESSQPILKSSISSEKTELLNGEETELLDEKTELLNGEETELLDEKTELLSTDKPSEKLSQPKANYMGKVTKRSDIYSIGAVLYYMISGTRPDPDFNKIKPIRSFNARVPEGLYIITEKAMSINPVKRYSSAEAMLDALNNIMKLDRRYRMLSVRRAIVSVICVMGLAASALALNYGKDVVIQERIDKYYGMIDDIDRSIDESNFAEAEASVSEAMAFRPDMPEAYYEALRIKYEKGEYTDCIDYYLNTPLMHESSYDLKVNMFFVAGNAYFELEDYQNASLAYEKALSLDEEFSDCYRDLAISYARLGKTDDAVEILEKAIAAKASNDQIMLIEGEIEISRGNFAEALTCLETAAKETDDEYILYRAIYVYASLCDSESGNIENAHKRAAEFIEQYYNENSAQYGDFICEVLAGQYSQLGTELNSEQYYRKSTVYYEKLINNASQKYIVYKNCFEIYYRLRDYNDCIRILSKMDEVFPKDYWVMMNYSIVHIDIQNDLDINQRSYKNVMFYYEKAVEYYKEFTKNGKTDPNMDVLKKYINQLAESGWITLE